MKAIFYLIHINGLSHYATKRGCENPASATSCATACSPSCFAVSRSHILFGYESLQLIRHMVKLPFQYKSV